MRRIATATVLILTVAACTSSPTSSVDHPQLDGVRPHYNGFTMGSGNRTDSPPEPETETDTSTAFGGGWIGPGGRSAPGSSGSIVTAEDGGYGFGGFVDGPEEDSSAVRRGHGIGSGG